MRIGMLWFDNDGKTTPEDKIRKAAAFYHDKYQQDATMCFVNPAMGAPEKVDGIVVKVSKNILVNHLWMGVEQ